MVEDFAALKSVLSQSTPQVTLPATTEISVKSNGTILVSARYLLIKAS